MVKTSCFGQEVRAALPAHAASLGKPCLSSGKDLEGDAGAGTGAGLLHGLSGARFTACARR